jgi:hypothetical protein
MQIGRWSLGADTARIQVTARIQPIPGAYIYVIQFQRLSLLDKLILHQNFSFMLTPIDLFHISLYCFSIYFYHVFSPSFRILLSSI